ncbi:hypothetical protein ACKWTF_000452 [Chironomus riparius]
MATSIHNSILHWKVRNGICWYLCWLLLHEIQLKCKFQLTLMSKACDLFIDIIIYLQDWTRKGGWRVIKSRTAIYPGDEGFPKLPDRSVPSDYANRGFKQSPI